MKPVQHVVPEKYGGRVVLVTRKSKPVKQDDCFARKLAKLLLVILEAVPF